MAPQVKQLIEFISRVKNCLHALETAGVDNVETRALRREAKHLIHQSMIAGADSRICDVCHAESPTHMMGCPRGGRRGRRPAH